MRSSNAQPPGPSSLRAASGTLQFRRDPLRYLTALRQRYGDVARFRLACWPMVLISHPSDIKRVLRENHENYDRDGVIYRTVRTLFGEGLITAGAESDWRRQRRLVHPAFFPQRVAALGTLMTDATLAMLERWERPARAGEPLDMTSEMSGLTYEIAAASLFTSDDARRSEEFRRAFSQALEFFTDYVTLPFPPLSMPWPRNRRYRAAVAAMDQVAYRIIRERRASQEPADDLLSILLAATDEEGHGLEDTQIRDEIVGLLNAGHETSANVLSWCWYLLARHPEAERELHDELQVVLAGRVPTIQDLPHLRYTRTVINEALRLYPPAWLLPRVAQRDDEIGGYRIPAKTCVLWSTYLAHRHPDFWEKPDAFRPERFSEGTAAGRARHAFMPFGAGPRSCVGNGFAMAEMQLVVATVAQRYRLVLAAGASGEAEALLALRPRNGLPVHAEARSPAGVG